MSTRAHVYYKDKSTEYYKGIYVHFDGYPSHLLKILKENYNSYEKVKELISYGHARFIDKTIELCDFYHRDHHEDLKYINSYILKKHKCIDFHYVFEDDEWKQF